MFQKNYCLVIALCCSLFTAYGQDSLAIRFQKFTGWRSVLTEAKKENKPIFVDCYATWCVPCKKMDKEVFVVDSVGTFYNDNFICVKVQMDKSANDNDYVKSWYEDAHQISKTYKIFGFPTSLFFSPEGKLVHEGFGLYPSGDFIELGRNALNPSKQYYPLLEKYKEGKLEYTDMPPLISKAESLEQKKLADTIARTYINEYLLTLSPTNLYNVSNIDFIIGHLRSTKDKSFDFVKANGRAIDSVMGTPYYHLTVMDQVIKWDEVDSKIYEKGQPFNYKTDHPDWNELHDTIKAKYDTGFANRVILWSKIEWLRSKKQWPEYCKEVIKKVENYGPYINAFPFALYQPLDLKTLYKPYDIQALNNCAWEIFDYSTNSKELQKALTWSKLVITKDSIHVANYKKDVNANGVLDTYANYIDTYANILYKLGRTKEAIHCEEKSIAASGGDGVIVKGIKANLAKMKKGEPTWKVPVKTN